MLDHLVFLTIPGLRAQDLASMPRLSQLMAAGGRAELTPSFPAVTWPAQATLLTGKLPREHGVIANGFYWRDSRQVQMWTAPNDKIQAPQLWDRLHQAPRPRTSAAWFPMLSKGCGADYICMPAPVHNPDGSESLWCYTRPTEYYGPLRDGLGHFPLQHFWGPLANLKSTAWIVDSAVRAAADHRPEFFYIYLPHLDYAAQKHGPDSEPAAASVRDLDGQIGRLVDGVSAAWDRRRVAWMAASEYVITNVDHVTYPNRALREAGLLQVRKQDDGEHLDLERSLAWALVDHQFAHVFVQGGEAATVQRVADLFRGQAGIDRVFAGSQRTEVGLDHERSGEVILAAAPQSWLAYYWWFDDALAPGFARTVDIHRKPGYDPVELFFDPATKSIPLDATLARGSHGAIVASDSQRGVLLGSQASLIPAAKLRDIDVAASVLAALE